MSSPVRKIFLAAQALVVAPAVAAQERSPGVSSWVIGVEAQHYSLEDRSVRQLAFPVAVAFPIGRRFTLDIGGHYATTTIDPATGPDQTLSSFTDTQLRGSYVFGLDRVVATLMVNLPTGAERTSTAKFATAASVSSNFLSFPVNSYGNGASATGGLAVATRVGGWNVGAATSLRVNAEYEPFSGDSIRYQPGLEGRLRFGLDRLVGSSRLMFGFTFSTFGDDEFAGLQSGTSGVYRPGNRYVGELSFTVPMGRGSLTGYAWDFYRAKAGDASLPSNRENVLTLGLVGDFALARWIGVEPVVEGRFWSPEGGTGSMYGIGTALRIDLSPRLAFAPSGRFDAGSLETAGGPHLDLTGWATSALLRYSF